MYCQPDCLLFKPNSCLPGVLPESSSRVARMLYVGIKQHCTPYPQGNKRHCSTFKPVGHITQRHVLPCSRQLLCNCAEKCTCYTAKDCSIKVCWCSCCKRSSHKLLLTAPAITYVLQLAYIHANSCSKYMPICTPLYTCAYKFREHISSSLA